jgi:hypothetical protein
MTLAKPRKFVFIAPWNTSFPDREDKSGHYMIPILWLRGASPDVTSSTDLGVRFSEKSRPERTVEKMTRHSRFGSERVLP